MTTLSFTQMVPGGSVGRDVAGKVGPGWDYYLDPLGAAFAGDDVSDIAFPPYLERSDHYRGLFHLSGRSQQGRPSGGGPAPCPG